MVERLVAKGADVGNRDNPFLASPFSWADHNQQTAIVEWMRSHGAIDLIDAVCFDVPEQVEALLRRDRGAVNRQTDHWTLLQSTPLHWAAWFGRDAYVAQLLEHGADPNLRTADGRTALDLVDAQKFPEAHARLVRHGARHG
jgi:ankyrin repeat protein